MATFGEALEYLKQGLKVQRDGWNGKGMFLFYVSSDQYHVGPKVIFGTKGAERLPWIGMKTADDKFVPWLSSQTDMLAEDWQVIE